MNKPLRMNFNETKMRAFAADLLGKLQDLGASDAEIYLGSGIAREVVICDGEIEKAESASNHHAALRAYCGQKSAAINFSFDGTKDYSQILQELVLSAQTSPEDPFCGLADPKDLQKAQTLDLDQFDPSSLKSIEALRERALLLEKASGGEEIKVDQSQCAHAHGESFYAATNGFERYHQASHASQSTVVIHQGDELTREFASSGKIYWEDLENIEETGKRAYKRAFDARNPVRAQSGRYPVMFDERISSTLTGHLLGAMNGLAIARRASWLIDYEDPVFPKTWSLVETPFRPRKMSSALYDGEGFVKKEQNLVQNGRPEFWISNLSAARQLDLPSSGHAVRSGVNTNASVRSYILQAPFEARNKLLNDMREGLLVTGFIGATINPHTGDYSRGVRGFWVRNGEIAEAVNEVTIASNLKDMLVALRAADDADEDRAQVVPSLLTNEMTIAGA